MRLTLRTLLAYLDDTLEPAQAKLIGQKVAESDTAQELIGRIREVTRRRRITTPSASGPGGKVDPNTIAEYLDNVLPAEKLGEVEQLALSSDVHLAEIAACHQILTLVLGEPSTVPPLAFKRMYGLVKGPESAIDHQPPLRREHGEGPPETRDVDETLRLGLPVLRANNWSNRLILLGGAAAAFLLLGVAVWQLLPPLWTHENNDESVAQGTQRFAGVSSPAKGELESKAKKDGKGKVSAKDEGKKVVVEPKDKDKAIEPKEKEKDKTTEPKEKEKPLDEAADPADLFTKQREIGAYEPPPMGTQSVLVQLMGDKKQPGRMVWQRILRQQTNQQRILTNAPLVSFPGYRSVVILDSGLRLTLWGNLPELWPVPPAHESWVLIHPNDRFALDVTVKRGRVALTNPTDKPLKARVRFDNPAHPEKGEIWDLVLQPKGTEVVFNLSGVFYDAEPFYPKKNNVREGPMALVLFVVAAGQVSLKIDDRKIDKMLPPPDARLLIWTSRVGLVDDAKNDIKTLPPWANPTPPLPPGVDAKARAAVNKALVDLNVDLAGASVETVLFKTLSQPGDVQKRRLAVRCAGAIDDLQRVIDAFNDKEKEVRWAAVETLTLWITFDPDNDYRLFDALQPTYTANDATTIMALLHGLSRQQLGEPGTYQNLIALLQANKAAIREIAYWLLWHYVPAGQDISYSAMDNQAGRLQAVRQWQELIPVGKLPPQPKGAK